MPPRRVEAPVAVNPAGAVFDRWAWLYALCRERLFTDHTDLVAGIMQRLFPQVRSPIFMEVGCGPGFYSIGLARRFPHWRVLGMDSSRSLLKRARRKASESSIPNCSFSRGDATQASDFPEQADLLFASRLLLILPDRFCALQAMYTSLRPGGILLIAEPLPGWRTTVALQAMRFLELLKRSEPCPEVDLDKPAPLGASELSECVARFHWANVQSWADHRYQYALCRKAALFSSEAQGVSARAAAS